ncbi:GGDEF domain-containing response regulator [Stutzerimonas frequens]|jgi:diguanylate cyclase (GGDEF)-like protein|uniref:GGDEF domain-containing response regulator n=1 Tax=Stutzerimonas TaxID=2901164 RepID=UPI0009A3C739|nr:MULTISPECIES: response regulator [Stutzerimonas]MBA4726872.1 response regulator [Pseudomonas sp.]AWT09235.1 GGDEF domain-containing protein [Stutzerimonas frequens]MBK3915957.1 response regulator [Stutzerimonas frequens]OPG82254.1 diguanylate cyclase [Stutzerimonas stutzeri]WAE61021.1 response regulator [Stutzerimonas sp. R40042]
MPNPHLSILVVDDAKFSSVMIGRALSKAGYQDIRFASSAADALTQHAQRPAHVLLADWLMPEMDGLELTGQIRQRDALSGHYSYVILLTGRDSENALGLAFDHGVDDFISKSAMNEQLLPRIFAADRLCASLQQLKQENHQLAESVASLEEQSLHDPLTGLGNCRYLQQRLAASLRQMENRGTALYYLQIGLPDADALRERYGKPVYAEILCAIGARLQQLVRPLDVVCRIDEQQFGLLALVDDLKGCSPSSFKRLHEGLNLRALKTSEGFISIKAGISLISLDADALPVTPQAIIERAAALLPSAYSTGRIVPFRLKQSA